MKLVINIRDEHIARGNPAKAKSCPVAMTGEDTGIKHVSVGVGRIRGEYNGRSIAAPLPDVAKKFIANFDKNKSYNCFKPITFIIDIDRKAEE